MTDAALNRMTPEEFLDWSLDQEDRYELVDGVPVPMGEIEWIDGRPVFMAGAKAEHDTVVVNLIVGLGNRLRGGRCRPSTADTAARMVGGNMRRPDVTVDCRPPERGATESAEPTVFFEVLSPSTRSIDFLRKGEEYKRLPTLRHFVLIEPLMVRVWVWTREADGWSDRLLTRLDDAIDLPAIGVTLPLTEVYEGVPFPPPVAYG